MQVQRVFWHSNYQVSNGGIRKQNFSQILSGQAEGLSILVEGGQGIVNQVDMIPQLCHIIFKWKQYATVV